MVNKDFVRCREKKIEKMILRGTGCEIEGEAGGGLFQG